MNEIHPRRVVRIEGAQAKAYLDQAFRPTPDEFRTVKDADAADREKADPGDNHICPLCKEMFFFHAFETHAPLCIKRFKAGRVHSFAPPGTPNAVTNYKNTVKITPGTRTP